MGQRIASQSIQPELIISSTALRARTTAELIAHACGYAPTDIKLENKLYCFDAEILLEQLKELDNSYQRILCVGHNPAITGLVNRLCNAGIDNVPTCGVCYLQFDCADWRNIQTGVLTEFDYPKKTV